MADNDGEAPVLRAEPLHQADRIAPKLVDQTDKLQQKYHARTGTNDPEKKKGPAGGFDDTPVPKAPPGYTLKITFHKAENLPFADIGTLSSDPYILAVVRTDLPKRHKQDPDLRLRTPTIHRNTNPEWNTEWIIANVPRSGFHLKCRLYDEDPQDHDDRLGNAHVIVSHIDDSWKGISRQKFDLKKRMGSKRAYTIRGCAALFSKSVKMGGHLVVSVENLGRTESEDGGRAYTLAPLPWSRHYSPLIGRLAGTKDMEQDKDGKQIQKYNFQSIQMQLRGPVPADLYHRYVEFKPFVAGMFTSHTLRGRLLNRALHHQHARIYNYDRNTKYGIYQEPCLEMTKAFLDFVHYDEGGRIFTYVLTLDAQFRFTETGKEFGIDLLSKHTMHSDVSIYIAFSGEFFIRRLKHHRAHHSEKEGADPTKETEPPSTNSSESHAESDTIAGSSNHADHPSQSGEAGNNKSSKSSPSKDPSHYELIIDNDSGTYRPNAKKLDQFRDFMASNFPGLKVVTLDCQGDQEKMNKLKTEQRERKKSSGKQITYLQNHSMSSLSSSDEEELEARAAGGDPASREHRYKREMHKFMGGGHDEHHYPPDNDNEKEGNKSVPSDDPQVEAETDKGEKTQTQTNPAGQGNENENENEKQQQQQQ